jgi:hypothetical protein
MYNQGICDEAAEGIAFDSDSDGVTDGVLVGDDVKAAFVTVSSGEIDRRSTV